MTRVLIGFAVVYVPIQLLCGISVACILWETRKKANRAFAFWAVAVSMATAMDALMDILRLLR